MMRDLGILLLLLALFCATVRADEDEKARLIEESIQEILAGVEGDEIDTGAARALARLGPGAVPPLFTALSRGLPTFRGAAKRETVLEALRILPTGVLNARIREMATGEEIENGTRLSAMRTLGLCGGSGSLTTLLAIAGEMTSDDLKIAPVRSCARTGVERLLDRVPEEYNWLGQNWPGLSTDLQRICLEAASAQGDRHALAFFGRVLQIGGDDPALVLDRMASITVRTPRHPGPAVVVTIVKYLESDRADVRRLAALVAGRLHLRESIDALIEMLADEDPQVVSAAWWSMKKISGLGISREKARWEGWLAAERAWWEDSRADDTEQLGEENTEKVLRGIKLLSTHRLYRDELTQILLPLLLDPDVAVRMAAVGALSNLGSPDAPAGLVRTLTDESEQAREAAHEALRAITGLDLPLDAGAWRKAVEER